MTNPGSEFLHQRNPNFHASPEVESAVSYLRANGESIPNQPVDKITAYIGFLSDVVEDGVLTGNEESIQRQIEHNVIETGEVPEGYFELQRRIAREQGHGDIEITPEMRRAWVDALQADQRAGLKEWVNYLTSDDANYPNWFRVYTFEAVKKLGPFVKKEDEQGEHKVKGEFMRRSRGTTAAYPDLNREALAYVYDKLNKTRVHGDKKTQQEHVAEEAEELQKLLKSANFGKLYAYAMLEVTPASTELRQETTGSWTKFEQTDNARAAHKLAASLQGHGTGWCTAGESTAQTHLSGGDFYVYYTRDEDGNDTVPRVAVRMQQGTVAEVRGINPKQELEPQMADVVAERLQTLPGGDEYVRKAEDMKRLTAIDNAIAENPDMQLSEDDLRFLYELERGIVGFGYERDPRIAEIRSKRGEVDKPELIRLIPETIRGQLGTAIAGYRAVAEQLHGGSRRFWRKKETAHFADEVAEVLAQKDQQWRENGVYDFLVEELINRGVRYNLVATPNMLADSGQIMSLARSFGKEQPYSTYTDDALYNEYSAQELSGVTDNGVARLSLIPSGIDDELSFKPVEDQRELLQQRQTRKPRLGFRVPSVLDAITYWYTLRAQGDKLADMTTFDKTYIRHFDLQPKTLGA